MDGDDVKALDRIIDNLEQAMEEIGPHPLVMEATGEAGLLLVKAQQQEAAAYGIDDEVELSKLVQDQSALDEDAWRRVRDEQ